MSLGPLMAVRPRMQAANALRILARHDALLTRANGFQVRMLYKQRLLDRLLPQLVDDYRAHAESPAAMTYLVALATLLPALPDAAVSGRVTELLPLLVHTLSIPDAHARASAARTLPAERASHACMLHGSVATSTVATSSAGTVSSSAMTRASSASVASHSVAERRPRSSTHATLGVARS